MHLKYPYSDAKFGMLSSYQISSDGRAVGLMCVALNGFHSDECKYSWSIGVGGIPIPNESYPVLYTGVVGKYVCTLCVEHYKDVRVFNITSEFQLAVHCIIMASCSTQVTKGKRKLKLIL